MTPYESAQYLLGCQLSVFPLKTKSDIAVAWGKYKGSEGRIATDREVKEWFLKQKHPGIGIAHGVISGNTEVLDIETENCFQELGQMVRDHGRQNLLDRLDLRIATPSGGWHIPFRCQDGVEGNQKLASAIRPVPMAELEGKNDAEKRKKAWKKIKGIWCRRETIAETRGEGGYTVAPGSLPCVHPANKPYIIVSGSYQQIPEVTAQERKFLLSMLRFCDEARDWDRILCESEESEYVSDTPGFFNKHGAYQAKVNRPEGLLGPLEDYANTASDEMVLSLLETVGWTSQRRRKGYYLTRPGKNDGHSATLGIIAPGVLFVFSTNAGPFEAETAYDAGAVFTLLRHSGDKSAAAKELASLGYGTPEEEFKKRMEEERGKANGDTASKEKAPKDTPPSLDWSRISLRPLSPELLPVPKFNPDLLPDAFRPWIKDITERGSFCIEFPATAAMNAVASVVGRQCGIKPKRYDDWLVVPNTYGVAIGHSGIRKSPAVKEALAPLERLSIEKRELYEKQKQQWEEDQLINGALKDAAKKSLKDAAKDKATKESLRDLAREAQGGDEEPAPVLRRFIVNDCTTEKLVELLRENQNGLLQYRDELSGFLRSFEKDGRENDREFYLEGFNGNSGFTQERIGRGSVYIPAHCLSVYGTIQPGPFAAYLRQGVSSKESDGLISRFQLMVYPDPPTRYAPVDRYPNKEAKQKAYEVFLRLAHLDVEGMGAKPDEGESIPYLRFDNDAQEAFTRWSTDLGNRVLSEQMADAMRMHLAKYQSLLPSLALLFHLIDHDEGSISLVQFNRAKAWCDFLEAHAKRLYHFASDGDVETASVLAGRLKQSLPNPFTPRQVAQKGWRGLSEVREVEKACGILVDRGYLQEVEEPAGQRGGRPSTKYFIHPSLLSKSDAKDNENATAPPYVTYETATGEGFVGSVGNKDKDFTNFEESEPEFEEGEI